MRSGILGIGTEHWIRELAACFVASHALAAIARKVPDAERVFVELGAKDRPAYVTLIGTGR